MERKPEWLRVRYNQQAVSEVAELMRDLKLNTVCKAANCPESRRMLSEAHSHVYAPRRRLHAQLPVLQRHLRQAPAARPGRAGKRGAGGRKAGLRHVVLTCSTRDDLPDGGARNTFAKTIRAIRARCPGTTVETLTSDMKGDHAAADIVIAAHPGGVQPEYRDRQGSCRGRPPAGGLCAHARRSALCEGTGTRASSPRPASWSASARRTRRSPP